MFENERYPTSPYLIPLGAEESVEHEARCMALPGYIVLVREPGTNDWRGIVEHSFSMGFSDDRTLFHWTSKKATSNLGGSFEVDGYADAHRVAREYSERYPDMEFHVYDARRDEELPVAIDWRRYANGCRPAKTLSGVNNKFDARNLVFRTKSDI